MLKLNQEMLSGAVRKMRQSKPYRALAIELGIAPATLNRIERCQGKPNVESFMTVCYWLGRSPMEFFGMPPGPRYNPEPAMDGFYEWNDRTVACASCLTDHRDQIVLCEKHRAELDALKVAFINDPSSRITVVDRPAEQPGSFQDGAA